MLDRQTYHSAPQESYIQRGLKRSVSINKFGSLNRLRKRFAVRMDGHQNTETGHQCHHRRSTITNQW
ncbi:Uncharacterised protein [Vibrio cholerae]|nr:Uncharacterised protein [Vibrio cholerae]